MVHVVGNKILHAGIDPAKITKVVDVGTGTGIWMDALATYLDPISTPTGQNRQYHGLDISPANFPSSHPTNFNYSVYNILQPIPEELKGKFDLVHVRLLAAALSKGDMTTVIENLTQFLQPGGWIQWEELDGDSWAGRIPSSYVREVNELVRDFAANKGMELNVPTAFLEAAKVHPDLQNISEKIFNTVKYGTDMKDAINLTFLWSCTKSAKMILQANGTPNLKEEYQRLENGAKVDIERDGFFWDSDVHLLLAQKK